MADQIVSWGGFDSKGTDGMGITGSLSVAGSTFISSSNATQLQVGNNSLFVSGSGNVGIGTTTPTQKLEVNGAILIEGNDTNNKLILGANIAQTFSLGTYFNGFFDTFFIEYSAFGTPKLLNIQGNGNIGIGTTTPTSRLQVKGSGTTSATTAFRVENANASGSMVVLDDGNVGIGTTTPSYKLDVAGDIIARDIYPTIYVDHSGTVLGGIRADATTKLEFKTLTTSPLSFQVNSDEKMRITDSGTVGIGTYSPTAKLQVKGSGTTNATTAFRVENANASGSMVVLDNGIVGIGTDTPKINLHISSDTGGQIYFTDTDFASSANTHNINSANGAFQIGTRNNNGSFVDTFYQVITSVSGATSQYFLTQGTSRILINNAGNVGIGTTTPTSRLQVKGSGTTDATTAFRVENANASASLWVTDNQTVNTRQLLIVNHATNASRTLRLEWGSIFATDANNELTLGSNYNDNNSTRIYISGKTSNNSPSDAITMQANNGVAIYSGSSGAWFNPAARLHVSGSGIFTDGLTVTGSTFISSSNATQLQVGNNSLFVSSSGDIGVGTTSPAYKLQVNGTARFGDGSPYLKVNPSSVEVEGAYLFAAYQAGVSFYAYESVFRGLIKSDGSGGNALKLGDTAERMRITGSNVGIGTTTPTSRLQVKGSGTTSATTAFRVENANASGSMVVLDNGNVGIGVTSPVAKLEIIEFTANNNLQKLFVGRTQDQGLYVSVDDNSSYITSIQDENESSYGNLILRVDDVGNRDGYFAVGTTSNVEYFRIKDGGNIGIGTTSPSQKLDVQGDISVGVSGATTVHTYYNSTTRNQIVYTNNSSFELHEGVNERVRISAGGSVGIGTSSPTARLQVKGSGTTNATTAFRVENSNASGSMVVLDDGFVGIGTTSPAYKLDIKSGASNSFFTSFTPSAGSGFIRMYQDSNNHLSIYGANASGTTNVVLNTNGVSYFKGGNIIIGGSADNGYRLQVNGNTFIKGSGTTSSTTSFLVQNANASSSLTVRDDTAVIIGGSTTSNSLNFATSTQNAGQHAINYTFYTSNNFPVRLVATATGANGTGYLEVWATSSDGGTATSANSVFRFGNGSIPNPNNISYLPLTIGSTTVSGSSSGQIMSVRTDLASADLSTLTLQAGNANYVNRAGGNLILSTGGSAGSGDGVNGYIAFRVTNTTASSGVTNSTSEVARFSLGKNLLIGTTTDPGYKLNVSGSGNFTDNLTVTGSATISNILTLTPQSPLPSGVPTGSFAVSSSAPPKPYFYDGTSWNALY
jgi:trimeric autotransporter adhesin